VIEYTFPSFIGMQLQGYLNLNKSSSKEEQNQKKGHKFKKSFKESIREYIATLEESLKII